jgi:imidazole glycerol phosphate synthase glutamine amidotransferase subunit
VLVGIIDLGINNLTSVQRAFSAPLKTSDALKVIEGDSKMERPDLLILPGLGSFSSGMAALRERNLVNKIKSWNREGTKLVGICLGMQLLGTESQESIGIEGLNLINSRVERLQNEQHERIPHTGWAATFCPIVGQSFSALQTRGDFYFVHSYHLVPVNDSEVLSRTTFGSTSFVSSVLAKNILGVQFHPEKSGRKGKTLISQIVQWARSED